MEALKSLRTNVPDWLRRLDDLNGQIEQRQLELAQAVDAQGLSTGAAKSVRNKGSTESLKPRDEPPAHLHDTEPLTESPTKQRLPCTAQLMTDLEQAQTGTSKSTKDGGRNPPSPGGSETPSAQQRRVTNQVKAAGQARARATVQKRRRTDSVISAEGAAPKFRTRSLIIVYYDSYVQSFFEELVKFVSGSRNMMRKAKMAARVAQIKRMAEVEMPGSDDEDGDDNGPIAVDATAGRSNCGASGSATGDDGEEDLPPLRYVSTRQMQPMTRASNLIIGHNGRSAFPRGANSSRSLLGCTDQKPDIYDELDKSLEYVQSMCEHGAHQFLRDGDCGEEVANVKRRLQDINDLSCKELDRIQKEDPAALEALPEAAQKGRSYRAASMRRDLSATKESSPAPVSSPPATLEVDEGIDDMDDNEPLPKLTFKSTRNMR